MTMPERPKPPERCPECDTFGYLILPGYGNCQTCLKLRLSALRQRIGEEE